MYLNGFRSLRLSLASDWNYRVGCEVTTDWEWDVFGQSARRRRLSIELNWFRNAVFKGLPCKRSDVGAVFALHRSTPRFPRDRWIWISMKMRWITFLSRITTNERLNASKLISMYSNLLSFLMIYAEETYVFNHLIWVSVCRRLLPPFTRKQKWNYSNFRTFCVFCKLPTVFGALMKMYKQFVLLPSLPGSLRIQKVCPKIKIKILLGENNSNCLRLCVCLIKNRLCVWLNVWRGIPLCWVANIIITIEFESDKFSLRRWFQSLITKIGFNHG